MQNDSLIGNVLVFIRENKYAVFGSLFFLFIAYTYFITHWSISIDSEIFSYPDNSYWDAVLSQARFPLIYLLLNQYVMPFWNDFFSVAFIYIASLIMATTINNNLQLRNETLSKNLTFLIFLLVFNISPIYTFFLSFTIYDLIVSSGILISAILFYNLTNAIKKEHASIIKDYFLNIFLLTFAITCYEIFVVYYICLALFFVIIHVAQKESISLRFVLKYSVFYIIILMSSLMVFTVIKYIIAKTIPQSGYLDDFIQYGKIPLYNIVVNLIVFFKKISSYGFNYFFGITFFAGIALIILIVCKYKHRSPWLVVLLIMFYISPFLLVLISGSGLPFRTLQPLVLVASLIWFLLAINLNNEFLLKCLALFIICCSLLNAQYINRIFYGDNMRLKYDINFANQIYSRVLNTVGTSIKNKPLVIIGKHPSPKKSFIIKSDLDTIGISFFDWAGNPPYNPHRQGVSAFDRIYFFMSWLGNDYIRPTYEQYNKALKISMKMKSYPDQNSVIELSDMIILKLSAPYIWGNLGPINFDLSGYKKIDDKIINYKFNTQKSGKQIVFSGNYSFKNNQDNVDNYILVKFVSDSNVYYFLTNISEDSTSSTNKADILNDYFWGATGQDEFKKDEYKISLIFINRENYSEIITDTTIEL